MERAMGIEPTSEAWEASILPLYDARAASQYMYQLALVQLFQNSLGQEVTIRNCSSGISPAYLTLISDELCPSSGVGPQDSSQQAPIDSYRLSARYTSV